MAADPVSLAVHRCRFVDFSPSAITALAFPPLPLPPINQKSQSPASTPRRSPKFATLAIGHANGNIDLCDWAGELDEKQCPQAWVVRKTLSGLYPSKVDSLVFVLRDPDEFSSDDVPTLPDLRLFSSGGGSELLEWDLSRGCIRRTINSQGGSIWAMAANPSSTTLALGCEDGSVRLISISDDTLTHSRRFDRVKCRILSIAWGPPVPPSKPRQTDMSDNDEEVWTDSWIVTGGSDSSLRKWDVSTGRVMDRMATDKVRGERTLVWSVGVLGDGTIVSGDSLGLVKFWDHRTCTQLQSFKGHGADVLCLTFGPEGTTVYSSGVDQKVTQYSLVKTSKSQPDGPAPHFSTRWVQTSSRRLHSHDVRGLAMWPPYTPLPKAYKRTFPADVAPILASGGLDMSVVVTPCALPSSTIAKVLNPISTSVETTFGESYHRRLAYVSGPSATSALRIARQARLLSCMGDADLTIWQISHTPHDDEDPLNEYQDAHESGGWQRVLHMTFSVHTNLTASALSDDGHWLVVSDLYETKLFSLMPDVDGGLSPKRVRDFASILALHLPTSPASTGGLAFAFTPDSSKLIMSTSMTSIILVIDLGRGDVKPRVLRKFDHHRQSDSLLHGRVVRGRTGGDGDVDMANPEGQSSQEEEDLSPVITNILRLAVSTDGQWLATSDDSGRTHVFNLDSIHHHCVLPSFPHHVQSLSFDPSHPSLLILAFPNNTIQIYDVEARQFPSWSKNLCDNLPKRLTHTHDTVIGVAFDPSARASYFLLWGSTWICKLRLDESSTGSPNKKRRRESIKQTTAGEDSFKMVTHYRPMLFVDFMSPGELVVVERPLVDVLGTLPPAFFKYKYGAS